MGLAGMGPFGGVQAMHTGHGEMISTPLAMSLSPMQSSSTAARAPRVRRADPPKPTRPRRASATPVNYSGLAGLAHAAASVPEMPTAGHTSDGTSESGLRACVDCGRTKTPRWRSSRGGWVWVRSFFSSSSVDTLLRA